MVVFGNRRIKNPILQVLFTGFGLLAAALALILVTGIVMPLVAAVVIFVLAMVILVLLIMTVLFAVFGSLGSVFGVLLLPFYIIGRMIGNLFGAFGSKESDTVVTEVHDAEKK